MKKALWLCALFMHALNAVNAQMVHRNVLFKQGDRYEKQVTNKSNMIMRRGGQTLNLDGSYTVSRSYVVNDTTAGAYSFTITTQKVTDTLKGMGQQLEYDSEKSSATGSLLEKTLKRLIGKSTDVVINKTGKITTVSDKFTLSQEDSLINLSSLLPDKFIVGNTLELIAGLPTSNLLKKGAKWTDSVLTTNGKEIIQYTINGVTDSTITIGFKGNGVKNHDYLKDKITIKDYSTSIITGYMIVDNNTSIVMKRFVKTDESGQQTINDISVSMEKKCTMIEIVKKL